MPDDLRILGVHGVGNHRSGMGRDEAAQQLCAVWRDALGPRFSHATVEVAYYAPDLRGEVPQSAADDLTEAEQRQVLRWVGLLGAPPEVAQGRATQPVRQAMDWVARKFGLDNAAVRAFVAVAFREVNNYLAAPDSPHRERARSTVAAAVERFGPDVVVAHSLGSVVAYEALWHSGIAVESLVTLGSPLAMPDVVFQRILPAPVEGRGSRPSGVQRWTNVADPGDLVSIPRSLSRFFDGVDDDLEIPIHPFGFHRVRQYLAADAVADLLLTRS